MKTYNKILVLVLVFVPFFSCAQDLYTYPAGTHTRWISFENAKGAAGGGGKENNGAKGHPSQWVKAGDSIVLADYAGAGTIQRIWMTIIQRDPHTVRSTVLKMYWDNSPTPAVNVPLGDFFGIGLGRMVPFQNALFTDPEGKSFNSYVPMPFRKHAKVVFINQSQQPQLLFYDIDLTTVTAQPKDMLYFHAFWNNSTGVDLGQDYEMLPRIKGKGRLLGTNFSVIPDKVYGDLWWGEGEVKMYLDGDSKFPTLVGTGLEDYIGTGWNLGTFTHQYQGCSVVDRDKGQYAFYRYHIPDPVWFSNGCRMTIQQMGGGGRDKIRAAAKAGGKVKPVTLQTKEKLYKLLEEKNYPDLWDDKFPDDEWTNFYRVDHYSSTVYFYLDAPENRLPALPAVAERLKGL